MRNLKELWHTEKYSHELEEYRRKVITNAFFLFGDGYGGSPERQESVKQRLHDVLQRGGIDLTLEEEEDSPFLSDIIWWKKDHFALAEVSLKVNGEDVARAKRRAAVLSKAGVPVLPVVVGSEWAHPETRELADREGVAWRVGREFAPSLIKYRRLSAS
ncbi:MAG: hypothetical protein NZ556_09010 [Fimbriimonadales bacterium]|nr:hypothetical protein [Fimbriimonadales bacterium]